MRRHWKRLGMVVAIAAVALSIVAVAYGATQSQRRTGAAGAAACSSLMGNPEAVEAMQGLRAEHLKDVQAWREQYESTSRSAEARAALRNLREEHWSEMQELLKKFGVTAGKRGGAGRGMMGGAGCGGGCGGSGAQGSGYGMMGGTSY